MDRNYYHAQADRQYVQTQTAPPPATHTSPFPVPAATQPAVQIPYSDPFHTGRDPFLPGSHARTGSVGGARAWTPSHAQVGNHAPLSTSNQQQLGPHSHQQQRRPSPPSQQQQHHPPPPQSVHHPPPSAPPNGVGMPLPPYESYDPARRRSLGGPSSPQRYMPSDSFGRQRDQSGNAPVPPPTSFGQRQMPPPSPIQNAASTSSHLLSAPRGPPTSSPFGGFRDFGAPRSSGMSIGSLLGREEERKSNGSPHSSGAFPASASKPMHSPGRARSASVRESGYRVARDLSPPRASIFADRSRTPPGARRDGGIRSPRQQHDASLHTFRAFQHESAHAHPHPHLTHEHPPPMRPTSQPTDVAGRQYGGEIDRRNLAVEPRMGAFRPYEQQVVSRDEALYRHERSLNGSMSQNNDRSIFNLPPSDRDGLLQGPERLPPGVFGAPLRDDSAPQFRPAYQAHSHQINDVARESVEDRAHDMRYQMSRPSPPPDAASYEHHRNGYVDRPPTLEEHQRMEAALREQQFLQRREGEGSVHRAILNLSPELERKGRNSPLPQAVQGAQSRHIGPGGDNPGIKTEFGRMFAGLGSGVGSAAPYAGYTANGVSTPSRMMSPARHIDNGDLARNAVAETDGSRPGPKAAGRAGKKNSRRVRDESERADALGTNKRSKTTHHHHHHVRPHHHHHHHHHNEAMEASPGAHDMMRTPSNPPPNNAVANQAHHHHHHHHAHPAHHRHHTPRPAPAPIPVPRKPSIIVNNTAAIEQCSSKPRQHLGSQLYTTELSAALKTWAASDAKMHYNSIARPFRQFDSHENSTFTVRVPRYFVSSSDGQGQETNASFEEICRKRQLWGSDIYTDDSDPIAAAVHSGWLLGDFGQAEVDMRQLCVDRDDDASQNGSGEQKAGTTLSLTSRPLQPVRIPVHHDLHITLLILPPLEVYTSTLRNHILSREWAGTPHNGMSFMIQRIDFVDESPDSRYVERGAKARKQRIAMEESKRREAAASLLMFATAGSGGNAGTASNGVVTVGA